jgi:hypothetical protein
MFVVGTSKSETAIIRVLTIGDPHFAPFSFGNDLLHASILNLSFTALHTGQLFGGLFLTI